MKHYEDRIENKKYKVLIKRTCDLCGLIRESKYENDWGSASYFVNETEVTVKVIQKEGTAFPEGGSGTLFDIDVCPTCFKERLIPWLISQGVQIKQKEWDY